jgi:DHHC palmitoyltransferase
MSPDPASHAQHSIDNVMNDVETAGADDSTASTAIVATQQPVATIEVASSDSGTTEVAPPIPNKRNNKMEAFEIELGKHVEDDDIADEDLDDIMDRRSQNVASILRTNTTTNGEHPPLSTAISEEEPNDMQSLLNNSGEVKSEHVPANSKVASDAAMNGKSRLWCLPCSNREGQTPIVQRMGNIRILFPRIYAATGFGWGVLGPHWFGPPCVMAILAFASYYFIYTCGWKQQRYGVVGTCTVLALLTLYNLLQAAYRDPGVIVKGRYVAPDPLPRSFRWCETCQNYQPPRAAHCSDCNVCILGFDHHCVWMSLCIGKGNFKVRYKASELFIALAPGELTLEFVPLLDIQPFMRFNLSWLAYLLYAIVWVSILAPILDKK